MVGFLFTTVSHDLYSEYDYETDYEYAGGLSNFKSVRSQSPPALLPVSDQ